MRLIVGTQGQFIGVAKVQMCRDACDTDGGNCDDDFWGPMLFHMCRNERRGTRQCNGLAYLPPAHHDPALDLPTIGSPMFVLVNP